MATAFEHLKVADLSEAERTAALECGSQVKTLKFRAHDGYEVCDDSKGLESASRSFIETFAPWLKFGGRGAKLQAFRFMQSASLPVDAPMLLLPTTSTTIANQPVNFGSYVQLAKDVSIQPEVLCLVFRAS